MSGRSFTLGQSFHGMPTGSIENEFLRLDFLGQTGPRIVRCTLAGTAGNLLAEVPSFSWETPQGTYFPYGGHRLWYAPESATRTSIPERDDLIIEGTPDGVRLTQPADALTRIRKSIDVALDDRRPAVSLVHRLANEGPEPIELAPWAVTMLPPGGVVGLPLAAGRAEAEGLAPNRFLALWPYTRWNDPRFHFTPDALLLDALPGDGPAKVGSFVHSGWLAYLRVGFLFCKRFTPMPGHAHADLGCNAEIYLHRDFVELETLGPLTRLAPGEAVEHRETWEIYPQPDGLGAPREILQVMEARPPSFASS